MWTATLVVALIVVGIIGVIAERDDPRPVLAHDPHLRDLGLSLSSVLATN